MRLGRPTGVVALVVLLAACTAEVRSSAPSTVPNVAAQRDRSDDATGSVGTTGTPPPTGQFVETFDGGVGLDRFAMGIYHRDAVLVSETTWNGDHDLACGSPDTQRVIQRDVESESFYLCKDHLMTSIGDTAGYSTGWFSPQQTFVGSSEVSWDVNVTDLGARQWWEVSIVPSTFRSEIDDCPQCSVVDWLSPDPSGLPVYPTDSVTVGDGPFGGAFSVHANGETFNPSEWQTVCGDEWSLGGDACSSKMTRLPFTIRDNGDDTLTLDAFGDAFTFPGAFPAGGFNVVFKDHNYTPDKDGVPVGHTWHWDNIIVR